MQLKNVSLTGADDEVEIFNLNKLASSYDFVEFALLFMPEMMGKARSPSMDWIENFLENYTGHHKAMHLCGSAFLDFVSGNFESIDLLKQFNRIQLNTRFAGVIGNYRFENLAEQIVQHSDIEFIVQYTDEENTLLPLIDNSKNWSLLFDASAGTGALPETWPHPIKNYRCGYAGGISPDNLEKTLSDLTAILPDNYETWIDMESGIRTDDRFDLDKANNILIEASRYYN